ncbi:MAG TPA: ABC transporter substrate-binding protein [Burkholderiales bacterium]|nr:ABC transporter substrate-binding protein [Burkholderiales bacterium]
MITTGRCAVVLLLMGSVIAAGPAAADRKYGPGVTDTEIKIGQTMPYSGPASANGNIGKAMVAYFAKLNDEGGINGRKVTLLSLDDAYTRAKTVEQTRKLVEQEHVLFIFGSLGTAANAAIHKYLNANKVPQLFITTGMTRWGDPKNYPWTMGWQPNLQIEARIHARYILANRPDARIAVLYQNDDFGKEMLAGPKAGLAARRLGRSQTELVNEALAEYLAKLAKPEFGFIGAGEDTVVTGRTSEAWLRKNWKRSRKK